MERRELLTSASVLAGAALTGCGGGSDETASGEIRSEIAAYTNPAYLVNSNGHYQVEVVFGLKRQVDVVFFWRGENGMTLAAKPETDSNTHEIGYSKLRVTNEAGRSYPALQLGVIEYWTDNNGVNRQASSSAGFRSGNWTSENVEHVFHPDSNQHEWRFYSADPRLADSKKLYCSVRFFELPIEEHFSFGDTYLRRVINNATVSTGDATHHSKHLPTDFSHDSHESRARKDPRGTHADTIVLPDHQQPLGYRMLIPCLQHASAELRPMLERTLKRHMKALGEKQASVNPMNGVEDRDHSHLISNELLRLVGGETLVERMRSYKEKMFEQAESLFDSIGPAIASYCKENLALSTETMRNESVGLLDEAVRKLDNDVDTRAHGLAFMNTVAFQAQFGLTASNWPLPGLAPGGALRFSVPLFRTSAARARKDGNLTVTEPSNYRLSTNSEKFCMSAVIILKLVNAASLLAIDIEFTLNFSRQNGKWIIDSMVLDPVIDIDLRSIVGRIAAVGVQSISNGAGSYARLLQAKFDFNFMNTIMENNFASVLEGSQRLPSSNFAREFIQPLRETLEESSTLQRKDQFATFEVSPMRFKFAHRDLGSGSTNADTPFWVLGEADSGYCPAVKHIFGYGERFSLGGLSCYVRLVNTLDLSLVNGDADFLKAQALIFD